MQLNLLAEDNRLHRLTELGDPLTLVAQKIDWEMFHPIIAEGLKTLKTEPKGPGGRPPKDYVMMFKVVMLQQWYNIADNATEYAINDRLSFQRFLGLRLNDKVVDEKTIWLFKENLKRAGIYDSLFGLFNEMLEHQGIITKEGSLIDASFVEVPIQRNSRDENAKIKKGETPEEWLVADPKAKNKLEQKDVDARWTKKNNQNYYGYKNHVKVDKDSKIVVTYEVTSANVHDSQVAVDLFDETDKAGFLDSAYVGEELEKEIRKKVNNPDFELNVIEKGYKNKPLTEEQKASNKEKSRVRCRVEHVFGNMTQAMGGMTIRTIGIARAKREVAMKNLAYNMKRYVYLITPKKAKTA